MDLRLASKYRLPVLLVLLVAADWLFYEWAPLGWVLGLFVALLWGVCWPRQWNFASRRVLAMELGALALTALSLVYAPGALNILLAFLLLYIYRITMAMDGKTSLPFWLGALPLKLATSFFEWAGMLFFRPNPGDRLFAERGVRKVALWVLPVLVTLLFAWLFALANPVLARFFQRVLAALAEYIRLPPPDRIAFWVLMILIVASVMSLRIFRSLLGGGSRLKGILVWEGCSVPWPEAETRQRWDRTATAMMGRALVLFNLLFLVQNVFDVEYLWAGLALPEGVTYAEYAHRGAYPLIAVALLSGVLVMAAFRRDGAARNSAWLRWMVYVWLAQNIFLIASSMLRLEKYVSVYSLTLLRVAAFLWMVLVAAGMILLMYRIYSNRGNGWLVRANLLAVLVLLLGCGFLNIAGFVADYNLDHCREATGDTSHAGLDTDYLMQLGYPALPALARAAQAGWGDVLPRELTPRIEHLSRETNDWRQWSLRKELTLRQLKNSIKE